jgi:hypothetical protein
MAQFTNQLSPGVNISEIDLTAIVPAVSSTVAGFVGDFRWGPAATITSIASEKELTEIFGTPSLKDTDRAIDFFCASQFLGYGNQLRVIRTVAPDETNANSSGSTGIQIKNQAEFNSNSALWNGSGSRIYARCPGELGNSLKVVVFDNVGTDSITAGTVIPVGVSGITFTAITGEVGDKIIFGVSGGYQQFTITAFNSATNVSVTPSVYKSIPNNSPAIIKSQWAYFFSYDPSTSDSASQSNGSNDELNILVIDKLGKFSGVANAVLEKWENVSKAYDAKTKDGASNYYFDVINQNSKYIFVDTTMFGATGNAGSSPSDKTSNFSDITKVGVGARTGMAIFNLSGASGSTGNYDYAFNQGYALFADRETVDISLLIGGRANSTLSKLIADVAETRKDCVAFFSPPLSLTLNLSESVAANNVINYRKTALNINSSYCVLDSGWKYIYDSYNDRFLWVPLNPDIAGLCARSDSIFDPWFSPAGFNRGIIRSVVKLSFNPNKAHRDMLYPEGINPVSIFPGEGPVLMGDKTLLAKPSAFDRINVRRLFIVLEKAIAKAAQFQLFEINDEYTRSLFRNLVNPFLRDVQGRRGITDFKVVCDETNNTGQVIDNNQFVADIYIKPARSINYIQLNFIATRTDAVFTTIGG